LAFFLKNSTLSWLKASVTLMDGRLKISFSGGGKKSWVGSLAAMACATDLGVSLYRVFFLIKASPFTPESGAENSNGIFSNTKADSQYLVVDLAKTKIAPFFFGAMFAVNSYNAFRVRKSQLCLKE